MDAHVDLDWKEKVKSYKTTLSVKIEVAKIGLEPWNLLLSNSARSFSFFETLLNQICIQDHSDLILLNL